MIDAMSKSHAYRACIVKPLCCRICKKHAVGTTKAIHIAIDDPTMDQTDATPGTMIAAVYVAASINNVTVT